MFCAISTEIGKGGKIHPFGNLREREAFVFQIVFQDGDGVTVDVGTDAVARDTLDGGRKVFGRYVETLGVVTDIALCATDSGGEHFHQLLDDVCRTVCMGLGRIAYGVRLKDIIDHRQAQASHQLPIEEQVPVAQAVPETMEITEQMLRLYIVQMDDRVLVERDASADAVVVGR